MRKKRRVRGQNFTIHEKNTAKIFNYSFITNIFVLYMLFLVMCVHSLGIHNMKLIHETKSFFVVGFFTCFMFSYSGFAWPNCVMHGFGLQYCATLNFRIISNNKLNKTKHKTHFNAWQMWKGHPHSDAICLKVMMDMKLRECIDRSLKLISVKNA